jgi:hypothetical protein
VPVPTPRDVPVEKVVEKIVEVRAARWYMLHRQYIAITVVGLDG